MSDYTPTTEEIREYVETGGEPRPWVILDEAEEAQERARGEAFDRWLATHDAEVRVRVAPWRRWADDPRWWSGALTAGLVLWLGDLVWGMLT